MCVYIYIKERCDVTNDRTCVALLPTAALDREKLEIGGQVSNRLERRRTRRALTISCP